ncbi:MAG: SpoIIE family protein phosphatase [Bacteroidales bacterium]|nr:SpoIIE family protein phosphatase [Bacteroidales bacterium]
MGKKSFPLRLSLNIILVITILTIVLQSIVSISMHRIILTESKTTAQYMLRSTIKDIEKDLLEIQTATENASWWAYANINNEKVLYAITSSLVMHNDNIVGSAIALKDGLHNGLHWFSPYSYIDSVTGEMRQMQLGNKNYDYFSMQWYDAVVKDHRPHWSDPYYDEGGGSQLMVTYSVPIIDTAGNMLGVITADLSLDWLQERMNLIKPYPNTTASLLNDRNHFLASSINENMRLVDSQVVAEATDNEKLQELAVAINEHRDSIMDITLHGERSFVVFGPLNNNWMASITFEYDDVLTNASRVNLIIILVGLVGLLVMFILCYITIMRLTRPIVRLTDAALEMSKGDFDTALPQIRTDDEIMSLRNAFDYMQRSLKDYISELKTTTATNERMESELNIARGIQSALLVRDFPHGVSTDADGNPFLHYDVHAFLEPAKQVGGDLYDFRIKGDTLYFAVGDVSGKGVPAALVMGVTRASLRFINSLGFSMAEVCERINNIVAEGNKMGMFVTLFCGRINLKTGECLYCNAGHNPIVVKPAGEKAYFLHAKPNIAIGLFPDFKYEDERIMLHRGDRLLFYTDGITEAEKADLSLYGDERLLQWANTDESFINGTSEAAVKSLYADVKKFTDGNEQNDDITIMIIGF